jgi:hypothetical protein
MSIRKKERIRYKKCKCLSLSRSIQPDYLYFAEDEHMGIRSYGSLMQLIQRTFSSWISSKSANESMIEAFQIVMKRSRLHAPSFPNKKIENYSLKHCQEAFLP